MSKKLKRYGDDQANIVLRNADHAMSVGHISTARDLYPDIAVPDSLTYTRMPVSLRTLVLLYEKTAIFVPPMKRSDLEQRWQTSLETIVELARFGIVQPIIGQAVDYGAKHFAPLMELEPPALFSRGVALLEQLDMGETLCLQHCPLPVEEMSRLPSLKKKYARNFPKLGGIELESRIQRELLTNYADLCIFGEAKVAESLSAHRTPQKITDRLLLANEVRTYPILFGLGGVANYDTALLRDEAGTAGSLSLRASETRIDLLPRNLPRLLSGLDIDVQNLDAESIREFHESGSGQRLRHAMTYFERSALRAIGAPGSAVTPEELLQYADELERLIKRALLELESPSFRRKAAKADKALKISFTVLNPAIGAALTHFTGAPLDVVGGEAVVQQVVTAPLRSKVVDAGMAARFNPGIANLWRIQKRQKKQQ